MCVCSVLLRAIKRKVRHSILQFFLQKYFFTFIFSSGISVNSYFHIHHHYILMHFILFKLFKWLLPITHFDCLHWNKFGVDIFIFELLVNLASNYKETTSNTSLFFPPLHLLISYSFLISIVKFWTHLRYSLSLHNIYIHLWLFIHCHLKELWHIQSLLMIKKKVKI